MRKLSLGPKRCWWPWLEGSYSPSGSNTLSQSRTTLPLSQSYNACSKTLLLGEQLWPGVLHSEPLCPSATVNHGRALPSVGTCWYLLCICHTNSHSDHGLLENKHMPFTMGHLPLGIPRSLMLKQSFQTQVQSQGPWVQMLTYYLLLKRLGHIP